MKKGGYAIIASAIALPILVFSGFSGQNEEEKALNCSDASNITGKMQCWESLIDHLIEDNKLDQAFDTVADLYNSEPEFSAECHGLIHKIGEAAYFKYAQTGEIILSSKTSYCGYGFYHGFLETLGENTGDFAKASEFCKAAGKKLAAETSKAFIACLHGIGHGIVDGSDPRAWGDLHKLTAPAIKVCNDIGETEKEKELCATGIFNSLAVAYTNGQYGLKPNRENPYGICFDFSENHIRIACFEEMNTHVMSLAGNDLRKAIKYAEAIKENQYAIIAIQNLSPVAVSPGLSSSDFVREVSACQSTQERLERSCIEGLVGGALEMSKPGEEYLRALDLCAKSALSPENRPICFSAVVSHSTVMYPKTKINEICKMIVKEYVPASCKTYEQI